MPLIDIVVEEPGWSALPLAECAETAALLALEAQGLAPEGFEISLLACDDTRIAELNTEFRGKPAATNVLSWPAFDLAPATPGERPDLPPAQGFGGPLPLGDVAIALQTVSAEAESASIPLKSHVTHLILHGCLHLLGFDHQSDADAAVMEGIETAALARIGVPDPYGTRGAAAPQPGGRPDV
ncbi:MAG: rRNA maturation RNase YbeY [Pseudomonadota bacterium]